MNVLISGGSKNGKSMKAQTLAKSMATDLGKPLYYIATMIPRDDEDHARIRRHIRERYGWGFKTLEQGIDLTALLNRDDVDISGVFLLDSVTALLDNEMFGGTGDVDSEAANRVLADTVKFAKSTGNTIFVSDYIYGEACTYGQFVEDYKRSLAAIDCALAKVCDRVYEVTVGQVEVWK